MNQPHVDKVNSDKSLNAFRTIKEVSNQLGLQQHVLRFWEKKFPQIKPLKRAGNRRYYRREDIELLLIIRNLLHNEGFTIKGVQKLIRENGNNIDKSLNKNVMTSNDLNSKDVISDVISDLQKMRVILNNSCK